MNQAPQFTDGMSVYKPAPAAPSFIIANLSVEADQFCNWLQSNKRQDGRVRLVVKESGTSGKYYAQLDTFEPRQS